MQSGAGTDVSGELAAAFGATFWVALALVAAALVPALLLPRSQNADGRRSGRGGHTAILPILNQEPT